MSECQVFDGRLDKRGYGRVGRNAFAHRLAWALHNGADPTGLHVCHKCDNPPCVNPEHLFLGTHDDNMRDMVAKGRARSPSGPANHMYKLTSQQVAEIREMRARGMTQQSIADTFGISQSYVSAVCLRQVRRDDERPLAREKGGGR